MIRYLVTLLLFSTLLLSCQNKADQYTLEIYAADSVLINVEKINSQMNAHRLQYILDMQTQIAADSVLFNYIETGELKRYPVSLVFDKYTNILNTMDTALYAINKLQAESSLTERFINDLKNQLINEELNKNDFYEKLTSEETSILDLEERVNALFVKVENEITAYIKMDETLNTLRNKHIPQSKESDEHGGD